MPGEAFRALFWDILTDVAEQEPLAPPAAGGDPVDETRVAVVIEDEADIRSLLCDVLEQGGFVVYGAGTGREGLDLVREHQPLVTTLDVNMPGGMDGFETARRIRAVSTTYLVMLTARTEEIDALQGLGAGADDYIAKPFRPRELRARIDAMLRRPRAPLSAPPEDAPPRIEAAEPEVDGAWIEHRGLRVHPGMRLVTRDDSSVDLTRSEFDILVDLMTARGRVVSKSQLALMLRGDAYAVDAYVSEADSRAIEVHMANLRRKLGETPAQPRWIDTVRGVGYRLTAA
ncbi:MAG: response regulator transcription factor [Microbacterium sp.]